jgi:chitosanase
MREARLSRRELLKGALSVTTGTVVLLAGTRIAYAKATDNSGRPAHHPLLPPNSPQAANLAARIKAVSNVFEVGGPEADYRYVEDLNDGRGYTVTSYGFCTATGEIGDLIGKYALRAPATDLKRFLPLMPPATYDEGTAPGFRAAWHKEIADPALVALCEDEADRLYFMPAVKAATDAGVKSPVGLLVFYDTILQHGGDDDPDSFATIYKHAAERMREQGAHTEFDLIRAFLEIRRGVLLDPSDDATRHAWRQSASRVEALMNLLHHNPELAPPVTVTSSDVHVIIG